MPSPNPSWTPGGPINSPVNEMVELDPAALTSGDMYKLLIGAIVPRPIAFVSTANRAGQCNLAPFSFFNGISSNPACLMISITRKPDGAKKDTLRNIEEIGQFVVNSSSSWLVEALTHCAAQYPYGVDEMKKAGLTALPSRKVLPPRVKESAVQFECELYRSMEIGDGSPGSATVVIGKVIFAHVMKEAYQQGRIDLDRISPAARLGGRGYCLPGQVFELEIPKV